MDEWQLEFEWLRVRHIVKDALGKENLPDLQAVLFLIGIQEYGHLSSTFTKEEKQDLMHVSVCKLLSYDGHYEFVGRDEDGWPHYKLVRQIEPQTVKEQEQHLKEKTIQYFKELEEENGGFNHLN